MPHTAGGKGRAPRSKCVTRHGAEAGHRVGGGESRKSHQPHFRRRIDRNPIRCLRQTQCRMVTRQPLWRRRGDGGTFPMCRDQTQLRCLRRHWTLLVLRIGRRLETGPHRDETALAGLAFGDHFTHRLRQCRGITRRFPLPEHHSPRPHLHEGQMDARDGNHRHQRQASGEEKEHEASSWRNPGPRQVRKPHIASTPIIGDRPAPSRPFASEARNDRLLAA